MRYGGPEEDVRSLPRPLKPRPLLQHPYVRVAPPSPVSDSSYASPLGHPHDFFQGKMGERYNIHSQPGLSRPLGHAPKITRNFATPPILLLTKKHEVPMTEKETSTEVNVNF